MPMDSTPSSQFPSERHLYYALARALNRGYSPPQDSSLSYSGRPRPALPVELVLEIFDLARILQPNPTECITVHSAGECNIITFGPPKEKLFFHSEPLSRMFLARVRKMRLQTVSRDQGWVGDLGGGSWSWFDIGVLQPVGDRVVRDGWKIFELDFSRPTAHRDGHGGINERYHDAGALWESQIDHGTTSPDETTIQREDLASAWDEAAHIIEDDQGGFESGVAQSRSSSDTPADPVATPDDANKETPIKLRYRQKYDSNVATKRLHWTSHHNELGSSVYEPIDGGIFGPDHEIWEYLDEGDVISVYACASFPLWQNNARSGKLVFWENFDPMGLEGGFKEENYKGKY